MQEQETGSFSARQLDDLHGVPTILIVDDDRAMRLVIRRALERDDYRLLEAEDGEQALTLCRDEQPDLVLMDVIMPVLNGFDACLQIRELDASISVLIMTGLDDEPSVELAFNNGAKDFIPKPIHWAVLRQRVARLLYAGRAEKYIAHLAYHDALTGLPNRQLFMDRFGAALSRAKRSGQLVAVMFLDLDKFKEVNDTLGHNAGDLLLRAIAERLVLSVREGDTVARLGGDEFTILLEGVHTPKDVSLVAEKIIATLDQPIGIEGRALVVTTSIGVAVFPDDGEDSSTLLKNADGAMYRAKQQGRKNYQFHAREMTEEASRRGQLSASLAHALERNELVLYYQPRFAVLDGALALVGVEALLRWQHTRLGMIYPKEFIPLAEELGLMVAVGEWVLQEVCKQGLLWQQGGFPELRLAFNLSLLQLKQRDLLPKFSAVIDATGIAAGCLEIELSEQFLMQHAHDQAAALRGLHELGLQLVVDDFGTGFTSLQQLQALPIAKLKIDQRLIRALPDDGSTAMVVRAAIGLAESLQLVPVAAGVENLAQLTFLIQQGCREVQGFLVGEPVLAAALDLPAAARTVLAGFEIRAKG